MPQSSDGPVNEFGSRIPNPKERDQAEVLKPEANPQKANNSVVMSDKEKSVEDVSGTILKSGKDNKSSRRDSSTVNAPCNVPGAKASTDSKEEESIKFQLLRREERKKW